jgi:hypothetical protein
VGLPGVLRDGAGSKCFLGTCGHCGERTHMFIVAAGAETQDVNHGVVGLMVRVGGEKRLVTPSAVRLGDDGGLGFLRFPGRPEDFNIRSCLRACVVNRKGAPEGVHAGTQFRARDRIGMGGVDWRFQHADPDVLFRERERTFGTGKMVRRSDGAVRLCELNGESFSKERVGVALQMPRFQRETS